MYENPSPSWTLHYTASVNIRQYPENDWNDRTRLRYMHRFIHVQLHIQSGSAINTVATGSIHTPCICLACSYMYINLDVATDVVNAGDNDVTFNVELHQRFCWWKMSPFSYMPNIVKLNWYSWCTSCTRVTRGMNLDVRESDVNCRRRIGGALLKQRHLT